MVISIAMSMFWHWNGTILGNFLHKTNFEIHYFPGLIHTDSMGGKCHNDSTKQSQKITMRVLYPTNHSI